jgi:hypothetical protein
MLGVCVSERHIDHVALDHNGAIASEWGVEGGDRPVVGETVVATDDAEVDNVALFVEDQTVETGVAISYTTTEQHLLGPTRCVW